MIVAKTNCCVCGKIIELDDSNGWNENCNNISWVICDECEDNGGISMIKNTSNEELIEQVKKEIASWAQWKRDVASKIYGVDFDEAVK